MKQPIRYIAVALGLATAVVSLEPSAYAQRREPQTMATVLPPGQAKMVGDIKILNVRNNVYTLYGGGANVTALIFPEGITDPPERLFLTYHPDAGILYSLSAAPRGTGSGRIISTPAGIDCGTACSAAFPARSQPLACRGCSIGSALPRS